MELDTEIRRIARDTAREVFREEVKQLEVAAESRRASRLAPEPLFTVEDIARLCKVTTKTVQRWIGKGLFHAVRHRGMREYLITRRDFEAFVTSAAVASSGTSRLEDLDREVASVITAVLSPPSKGRR